MEVSKLLATNQIFSRRRAAVRPIQGLLLAAMHQNGNRRDDSSDEFSFSVDYLELVRDFLVDSYNCRGRTE